MIFGKVSTIESQVGIKPGDLSQTGLAYGVEEASFRLQSNLQEVAAVSMRQFRVERAKKTYDNCNLHLTLAGQAAWGCCV